MTPWEFVVRCGRPDQLRRRTKEIATGDAIRVTDGPLDELDSVLVRRVRFSSPLNKHRDVRSETAKGASLGSYLPVLPQSSSRPTSNASRSNVNHRHTLTSTNCATSKEHEPAPWPAPGVVFRTR